MPIYEFDCTACGHDFERLQKLSDADPVVCPACGKETVKRKLSAPSFRLAGSGWYETDFKTDKDKKRNLAGSDDGSGSGGGSKPSGNEAAKPAEPAKSGADTASSTPATAAKTPASTPSPTSSST